jgi:hypothetical protein
MIARFKVGDRVRYKRDVGLWDPVAAAWVGTVHTVCLPNVLWWIDGSREPRLTDCSRLERVGGEPPYVAPGSPLDDPAGEKIGGHSYDPTSHNGRCPRCRGRAYVGLLSVECIEVSCEEWREPKPTVREAMISGRDGEWTSEPRRGERPACERVFIAGERYAHPTREGAIAAWKRGAR